MLSELAQNPFKNTNYQGQNALYRKLNYFRKLINQNQRILDVGGRNPLTEALEKEHKIKIDNTSGDLDLDFNIPGNDYDVILYSHTIEHQFNPLYTLVELKKVLNKSGVLYVLMPERGKLLWTKGHYHEIDDYRFNLLIKRAGFEIIDMKREKAWRHWTEYIKGIRPFYRLIREHDAIYALKKAN